MTKTALAIACTRILASSAAAYFSCGVAHAQECAHADLADRQGVGAFNSILDGQPPAPDQPQLQSVLSFDAQSQTMALAASLGVTPSREGFFCESQISLVSPQLLLDNRSAEFAGVWALTWEHRWRVDEVAGASVSSNLQLLVPNDGDADGWGLIATGILTRSTPSGVVYFNGSLAWTASERRAAVSGLIGYKHIWSDDRALYVDAILAEAGELTVEVSFEQDLRDGWSLGPGLSIVGAQTPQRADLVIGMALSRGF